LRKIICLLVWEELKQMHLNFSTLCTISGIPDLPQFLPKILKKSPNFCPKIARNSANRAKKSSNFENPFGIPVLSVKLITTKNRIPYAILFKFTVHNRLQKLSYNGLCLFMNFVINGNFIMTFVW
jgi:hypothetical protein